jgi:hypothetical protein
MEILSAMLAGQSCGNRSVIDACSDWTDRTRPLVMRFGAMSAVIAIVLILLSAA